jgi:hypothetical protein
MGGIKQFSRSEAKKYKSAKSIIETLDIDCKNAIETVYLIHPGIVMVANRLYSLAGPFITDNDGIPLVSTILREACDEFENVYVKHGIRLAYHEFVMVVKRGLPRFLDYTVLVHLSKCKIRQVDFISEDVVDVIPKIGCRVEARYTPIDPSLTEHEMSLIMLHRVFNRDDLITLGIPSMGYQTVEKFKNAVRY